MSGTRRLDADVNEKLHASKPREAHGKEEDVSKAKNRA